MKNKREFIIACTFFLVGASVAFLLIKDNMPVNRQNSQSLILQNKQSSSKSNTKSLSLKAAIELIKQKGYTVYDSSEIWYSPSQPLNVLIGTCTGSADGYCNQAFFFYNGKYLGTDTADPSIGIETIWRTDNTIALYYRLYRKDDPLCCSTTGAALVRYQWDGVKLVALDPIPTSDWFADIHR